MQNILLIAQVTLAVMITVAILLQAQQGTGFGSTWQGGGETYHTRRGLEKVLFYFTIIAVTLFVIVAIAGFAI
jgi:protein translocase SecG subunit